MANTYLTISMVTREALMVLKNETVFTTEINRDYDDQFGVTGAKIGAVVNARKPARFIGTTGPALGVEDFNETYVPVVLTTQFHVDTQFTEQDLLLSVDEFSDRVIQPGIATIANKIDRDMLVMAKNNTYNIVGIPGTVPTGLLTYLTAGAILTAEAAPRDGRRSMTVEPFTGAAIVDALKGLFTPDAAISQQYRKGLMGRDAGGMNWREDQNVVNQAFGFGASTTVAVTFSYNSVTAVGALTTGWASSSTITITNSAAFTLNHGDTFTIAGIAPTNPQNRQAYGSNRLRTFVVNATTTSAAAGTVTLNVSPAIITAGQFQNCQLVSTSTTAAVTPTSLALGSALSVVSPQNILCHKSAFTLAMADLPIPRGVAFAGRAADKKSGMSVRIVRQYTINNDSEPCRIDVLYGGAPLYPELSCRVAA
jgi:hypothetical protein